MHDADSVTDVIGVDVECKGENEIPEIGVSKGYTKRIGVREIGWRGE